ncbi:MAG: sulfotransferase [Paracoccaceae bacterium]
MIPDVAVLAVTAFALALHLLRVVSVARGVAVRRASLQMSNIARLDFLKNMLPDASIVLVLRDPIEHALSLWTQHKNFTTLQASDPFVARYMADIGHCEFGELHRPLLFENMGTTSARYDRNDPSYWLAYWVCAFAYVATRKDQVFLLPYEPLCADPMTWPGTLCCDLNIASDELEAACEHVRPASLRATKELFDPELIVKARELFESLAQRV